MLKHRVYCDQLLLLASDMFLVGCLVLILEFNLISLFSGVFSSFIIFLQFSYYNCIPREKTEKSFSC